jgi:phospholipase D
MNKKKNTIEKKYQNLFNVIAISLIIGFVAGLLAKDDNIQSFFSRNNAVTTTSEVEKPILTEAGKIELCFTPPSGCGKVIANLISKANESIYVQAYGITSTAIVSELISAHNRGIKVRILLDKSNLHDKYSKMAELQKAGIDVSIDAVAGIAHNKVIIIDESITITGSFNFTRSADSRNVENVIIVDDKEIAQRYIQNWLARKEQNTIQLKLKRH